MAPYERWVVQLVCGCGGGLMFCRLLKRASGENKKIHQTQIVLGEKEKELASQSIRLAS